MTRTPNPPAFVAAVHDHLADAREQFNYEALLHTFLDNERFHRWTEVVARRRPLAGAHVLSSGCGLGGSLLAWHDAGAARVAGVEVDDDYVRMAALRVAELPTVTVTRYDGARLPFDDASFDIVESMDVIEHVADPSAYLAELLRVLRPDGIVLLVTPNRLWPVEQHLSIVGPPWLPVGVADRVWGALARLPGLGRGRRVLVPGVEDAPALPSGAGDDEHVDALRGVPRGRRRALARLVVRMGVHGHEAQGAHGQPPPGAVRPRSSSGTMVAPTVARDRRASRGAP